MTKDEIIGWGTVAALGAVVVVILVVVVVDMIRNRHGRGF